MPIQTAAAKNQNQKKWPHRSGQAHSLPDKNRTVLKGLLLVYKSLKGLGPKYLSDLVVGSQPQQSSKISKKPGGRT